jgi:hypothetical protein
MVDSTPSDYHLTYLRDRWERDRTSRVFLQLAEEYRRRGLHTEALGVLETGLAHHPGYLAAQVSLGRCRLEAGQIEGAAETLEGVLAQDPTQAVAIRLLIDARLRLRHPEAARDAIDRCRLLGVPPAEVEAFERRLRELREELLSPLPGETAPPPPPLEQDAFVEAEPPPPVPVHAAEAAGWELERSAAEDAASAAHAGALEEGGRPSLSAAEPLAGAPLPATPAAPAFASPMTFFGDIFPLPRVDPPALSLPLPGERRIVRAAAGDPFALGVAGAVPPPGGDVFALRAPAAATAVAEPPSWDAVELPEPPPAEQPAEPAADEPAADEPAADEAPAAHVAAPPLDEVPAWVEPTPEPALDDTWAPAAVLPEADRVSAVAPMAPEPVPMEAVADQAPERVAAEAEAATLGTYAELPPEPEATPEPTFAPEPDVPQTDAPPAPAAEAAPQPTAFAAAPPELRGSETGTATLGELYLRQGYLVEAERIFRQVLTRDPENEPALKGLETIGHKRAAALSASELLTGDVAEVRGVSARKILLLERYLKTLRRGAQRDVSGTPE